MPSTTRHVFWEMLCLRFVQGNLITLVQKQSHIEQNMVAFVRGRPFALSLFKQFEPTQAFHDLV